MHNLKMNLIVFDPKMDKIEEIYSDAEVKLSAIN